MRVELYGCHEGRKIIIYSQKTILYHKVSGGPAGGRIVVIMENFLLLKSKGKLFNDILIIYKDL